MHLTVIAKWNGNTCLEAKATAVMAHDIARSYLADNFAGLEHKAWLSGRDFALLSLDRISMLALGDAIEVAYADDTGNATIGIYR